MNKKSKKQKKESVKKSNFFKTVLNSITNLDKYPEVASQGFKKAYIYFIQLTFLLAVVMSLITIFNFNKTAKNLSNYLSQKVPNFSYSNNLLKLENKEEIFMDDSSLFGQVIIDTKTDAENKIKEYQEKVAESGSGIIIFKNQMIIKESGLNALIKVEHKDLFGQVNINQFVKQDLIDFINSKEMYAFLFLAFIFVLVYSFIGTFLNTLINVVVISIFGYFANILLKTKIRYTGIFNMAVYSITLSVILEILYVILNTFTGFKIQYFDVMYILCAAIYMFASIFILKSDSMKKNEEVQKIIEIENNIKNDQDNKKEEEKNQKEKDELNKKDNEKEEKQNNDDSNLDGKLEEEGN